jgi:hypothetical protein
LPNFTIRLQTSPGKDVGEPVNSLPPVKSPLEPWASGDTVPPTWTVEVASVADVNKIIDKKIEELTLRISKLEAQLKRSEKDSSERADQAEHPKEKPASDKASDEKSEPTHGSDRKVETKSPEEKPEEEKPQEHKHGANASSGSKAESKKNSVEESRKRRVLRGSQKQKRLRTRSPKAKALISPLLRQSQMPRRSPRSNQPASRIKRRMPITVLKNPT